MVSTGSTTGLGSTSGLGSTGGVGSAGLWRSARRDESDGAASTSRLVYS
ncbi:Uncharacterised protein [Mycobacteroides abscessus subsp. abscessus]|nr:Uncharacterised protein [Mycobacteroides abscessus subsp. abscessus]